MPVLSLSPAGQVGLITDLNPAELPPHAWSAGQNIRFAEGAAVSVPDSSILNSALISQPNWALSTAQTTSRLAGWVVGSPARLYSYITGILTDITRETGGSYGGATSTRWSGGVLGGVTVVNNGVDVPQAWSSVSSIVPMVDLPNWPADTRCACLRSFKQYLVALDITKGSTRYFTTVKWSHPADPGTVPYTWDETDPTRDAGEYPLSETAGAVVDCVPLRDTNIIYKEDSVWGMQYIGGTFIFRFYKIFGDFGVPARDCAAEYQSGKHFVFTGTDLKIHDGQTAVSIVDRKMRKKLRNLSTAQLLTCYVAVNQPFQEVWFCYRRNDDGLPGADTAITYSWVDGTLGIRDLADYRYIASGRFDPPVLGVITWENAGGTWADHPEEWGEALIIPSMIRMLGFGDHSVEWLDATPMSSGDTKLERTFIGVAMKATQPPDLSTQKFIKRIWPRFKGRAGDVVYITLGKADHVGSAVDWTAPKQYQIGVDKHVDCTLTGKLFAIRIESSGTAQWTFNGMDADIKAVGTN